MGTPHCRSSLWEPQKATGPGGEATAAPRRYGAAFGHGVPHGHGGPSARGNEGRVEGGTGRASSGMGIAMWMDGIVNHSYNADFMDFYGIV